MQDSAGETSVIAKAQNGYPELLMQSFSLEMYDNTGYAQRLLDNIICGEFYLHVRNKRKWTPPACWWISAFRNEIMNDFSQMYILLCCKLIYLHNKGCIKSTKSSKTSVVIWTNSPSKNEKYIFLKVIYPSIITFNHNH